MKLEELIARVGSDGRVIRMTQIEPGVSVYANHKWHVGWWDCNRRKHGGSAWGPTLKEALEGAIEQIEIEEMLE